MTTAIAMWGNSAAVRISTDKMRQAGLSKGDSVNLEINERGNLEILPQIQYRAGGRRKLVTFEELFRDYSGTRLNVGDRGDGGRQGDT